MVAFTLAQLTPVKIRLGDDVVPLGLGEFTTGAVLAADKAVAASAAALSASQVAQGQANFRATIAEALNAFAVGTYFTSTDTGAVTSNPNIIRMYLRTSGTPGYADQGDAAAPVAIPDLAGTVTGKNVPRDGNIDTGAGTNGAPALQALANSNAPEVKLPGFYDLVTRTTGITVLSDTVVIPDNQRWSGSGMRTAYAIAAADPKPNGYFLLSTTTAYQAAQTYKLFPNKKFGGLFLDGRAAAANGKSPVGIVVGAPNWRIHDIYAFGMQTVVRGANTGGSGGVDPRADHLRISNLHLNNQPNPVDFDPANPGNSRYGIDWLRTPPGADTAEIEACQGNVTGTLSSGTGKRCRLIGLRDFTSAMVRGIINGDVFFYQSNGVVENSYFESGVVSNMQSDMVVSRCHFWMRSEVTCGADVGAVPLQFLTTPSGVASASQAPSSLTARDCVWNYDAAGSGSVAGNVTGLGGYSLTNPNFTIGSGIYGTMTVENCWRAGPYSNGRGWYQRYGINCGMADFDNYSHFASVSSRFFGSASGGSRWHIEASRGAITETSATSANGLESASFDTSFIGPFKGATATYFYRVAILHDKIRRIGILGGLEVSQAATNGATGAINLRLGFDLPGGGYIARVYRGTSSGNYDRYVDVPVIEAGRLFDTGVDIAGYPWITRTAGAADAVNAGLSGGLTLVPLERTSGSDAYGRVVATALATTMPTVGGWRRGDLVMFTAPIMNGSCEQYGWRRLTNCTSASPAHVLGTDWEPIINPITGVNGQRIGTATASMTLNAGERLAIVGPGATNQTITVAAANEVVGYWFLLSVSAQNLGSFAVSINKASGGTSVTLRSGGVYLVTWRDDLATWHASRIGNMAIGSTIDEGSNGFEQYVSGSGSVTFNQNAALMNVSSVAGSVAITMPANIEQGGVTRRLLVRSYTNAITVAKSTGTVSSSGVLTQTGLYELVYTQGVWLATRIGAVPA